MLEYEITLELLYARVTFPFSSFPIFPPTLEYPSISQSIATILVVSALVTPKILPTLLPVAITFVPTALQPAQPYSCTPISPPTLFEFAPFPSTKLSYI